MLRLEKCFFLDIFCHVKNAILAVIEAIFNLIAQLIFNALMKVVESLVTLWLGIGTPAISGKTGAARSPGAFADPVMTILGYIMWGSFAVATLAMLLLGVFVIVRLRRGEGFLAVGKVGIILGGVILVAGASGLVSALLPKGPNNASGAVGFLQGATWWLMLGVATGATMIGAARMAFLQRSEPGKDILVGILRLIVVSGFSVGAVSLATSAADEFAIWMLSISTGCESVNSDCMSNEFSSLLTLKNGLGAMLLIILGLVAVLATLLQVVLIIARSGMLVVLIGILPLSTALAIGGEGGKSWYRQNVSWLLAFILYKPAVAVIYATAFTLLRSDDTFADDPSGVVSFLTGLMMMILAVLALPALMRFLTPMVGAMGGGSLSMPGGFSSRLPTGAATTRTGSAAASGRSAAGGGSPSGGASGATGSSGMSATSGARSAGGGAASTSSAAGSAGASGAAAGGAGAAAGGAGAAAGGAGAAAGGAGAAAGGAGAAAGGAGAAAGGAGAAAAGGAGAAAGGAGAAAGGPIGVAAMAASAAVKTVADTALSATDGSDQQERPRGNP